MFGKGRGSGAVFGGGARAAPRPMFEETDSDDAPGRGSGSTTQGSPPMQPPMPQPQQRASRSPLGQLPQAAAPRAGISGGPSGYAGIAAAFPSLSVDGNFAQQVAARGHSPQNEDVSGRTSGPLPSNGPRFEQHDEAVYGGGPRRSGSPTGHSDSSIVPSRDPSPRRFDSAPKLAAAPSTRQNTVINSRDLFGLAAATNAAAAGPTEPEDVFDFDGFRRVPAPTISRKPPSPRRASPPRVASPNRRSGNHTAVVSVAPYNGPQPADSHAPRLRTAERSRMSPLAERKAVHVTAAMTGRQAQMEAELDRLARTVAQRDAQVSSLEMDNQRLRAELRDAELRNTTILDKYRSTHESLAMAVNKLRGQQRDIERLQGALVGESTDNDVLRHGFTSLLRSAKGELTQLQEDAEARKRAEWYMR